MFQTSDIPVLALALAPALAESGIVYRTSDIDIGRPISLWEILVSLCLKAPNSHWCRPSNHFFHRHRKLELCFYFHTISRAAAQGQDEFLLISILFSYLFAIFVNQFSYYTLCKNEIVVPLFSVCLSMCKKKIRSDYLILKKKCFKFET